MIKFLNLEIWHVFMLYFEHITDLWDLQITAFCFYLHFLCQLFLELELYMVSILEANKPVSIRGIKS